MAKATILVVEDDPDIQELISYNLKREGYSVLLAGSAESAAAKLESARPDLVLLDVMLPGKDGLEFLRALRRKDAFAALPVILVTAKGEDSDQVAGLELGADDYVPKPFSPRVLVARVRAALRRAAEGPRALPAADGVLEVHGLRLDCARHEASVGGREVELSASEFALLERLLRDPGRVFTRAQIIDSLRGPDYPVTERSVDVLVLGLRKKLGEAGDLVETVRGVGYKLRRPGEAAAAP